MSEFDPYAAPDTDAVAAQEVTTGAALITPQIVTNLRQTKPWMIFLAVMGFIFGGLSIIGGILLAIGISVGGGSGEFFPGAGTALGLGMALFYAVVGVVFNILPAVYLLRTGKALSQVHDVNCGPALETALKNQKSFWKLMGILFLSFIALYFVVIVVVMLVAASSAAR